MKYLFLILAALSIFACNSTKQKENTNPIVIQKAFYQNWYGGREGIHGIKIEVHAKPVAKDCTYQTMYYLGKQAKIITKQEGENIFLRANINTSTRRNRMLSVDRDKEYGNQAPIKLKYPNLTKNEVLIEYLQNDKLKHFKVPLIRKEPLFYQ